MSSFAATADLPALSPPSTARASSAFKRSIKSNNGLSPSRPQHDVETDRMASQTNGRNFLPQSGELCPRSFAERVGERLRDCYGHETSAAKRLARDAGSSIDAAENWLEGRNAPNGMYLVKLMAHCDEVLDLVLSMAGRAEALEALHQADAVQDLKRAVERLEGLG